ncbi:MAG TPA: carboxypeptidase-like regulatory domain-containing protein, partial [Blastocatellia bacterium]|nr:carboxypeptidase-like regulatory domain-containing protein [Blastocatellia bacterium]
MKRIILTPICKLAGASVRARLRRYGVSLIAISLALSMLHPSPSGAAAQTTTSTIEGTVTDANGAVIVGAEVKASGTTLASERVTRTDSEGFYRLTALPAGTYTLTVSQSGFAPRTSKIELTLNRVVTFDVQLQVGSP